MRWCSFLSMFLKDIFQFPYFNAEFKLVTKEICKLPSYLSTALFRKIDVNCNGKVSRYAFNLPTAFLRILVNNNCLIFCMWATWDSQLNPDEWMGFFFFFFFFFCRFLLECNDFVAYFVENSSSIIGLWAIC